MVLLDTGRFQADGFIFMQIIMTSLSKKGRFIISGPSQSSHATKTQLVQIHRSPSGQVIVNPNGIALRQTNASVG